MKNQDRFKKIKLLGVDRRVVSSEEKSGNGKSPKYRYHWAYRYTGAGMHVVAEAERQVINDTEGEVGRVSTIGTSGTVWWRIIQRHLTFLSSRRRHAFLIAAVAFSVP